MEVRYFHDPESGEPHVYEHGVSESEVEYVLRHPGEDRPGTDDIVEWSDEDKCFIGQCPGVVGSCCHGDNEAEVYAELCEIVDEWLELIKQDGKPLPPPTAGQGIIEQIA